MNSKSNGAAPVLTKAVGLRQLFALAFGSIIGVGWIVALGVWLGQAGSLGAMAGFLGGGTLIVLIGFCYAEAATMFPVAGGEVAYAYEMYGTDLSFLTGWLLLFSYIAVLPFESISVGWILSALFPGFEGPVLYRVLGEEVRAGSLGAGLAIMGVIVYVNYRGVRSMARVQELLTFGLIGISLVFVAVGLVQGDTANLQPHFVLDEEGTVWLGILAVFGTAPFWFAGFDTIPQAMGEKAEDAPIRLVARVILLSVAAALVFYLLVILVAAMALPRGELLALELPVAGAFEAAFGSPLLAKLVLTAGLFGILSTWNAMFYAASRVVFALGRAHMISAGFGDIHAEHHTPWRAVLFVGLIAALGTFAGRGAILPIVNSSGAVFGLVFFLICLGVLRLRRLRPDHRRPYRAPGGRGPRTPLNIGPAAGWGLVHP